MMLKISRTERQSSRHWTTEWIFRLLLLFALLVGNSSVVLTQTHPAAPYVCRTGNITLRCQYDGVENLTAVLWVIGTDIGTTNLSTFSGHSALPHTTTYQGVVVDSYTDLRESYQCDPLLSNGTTLHSNNFSNPQIEPIEVTISNLTLANRTATTLSVTWSAGYPKCYSFAVSHSTQDGSINVTQPADSDTSHTLTSLQPGTTYRIEVEAVRKGAGVDVQRAKVMGNFTTENATDVPSATIIPNIVSAAFPSRPDAYLETAGVIAGVVGILLTLVLIIVAAVIVAVMVLVHRRKTVNATKASAANVPNSSNESATHCCGDTKQTYAVLDWQNQEQRPIKAPDNDWFTVQYSEVRFDGTN